MRGKSEGLRIRAISGEYCQKVHQFIDNIPVKQVHCSNIIKIYLSAELNVKIVYKKFLKKHQESKEKVKYKSFLKYFHKNFNLSFSCPQRGVYSKYEKLGIKIKDPHLNENVKKAKISEQILHKRRASKFLKTI